MLIRNARVESRRAPTAGEQSSSRAVAQSSAESRAEAPAQVHFQLSTAKYLAAPQAQRGGGGGGGQWIALVETG